MRSYGSGFLELHIYADSSIFSVPKLIEGFCRFEHVFKQNLVLQLTPKVDQGRLAQPISMQGSSKMICIRRLY